KRYGQNTLEQLLAIYPNEIPELTINDYPKYAHRGFMIDCSRHFFTVTEIKKQIAVMALLKLNIFHWHLTDDQGWRIAIKKYPLLTEYGAKRLQTRNDKTEVGGYYTQDEIKEIVLFCQTRGIDVIPEIDMPGHFTAACSAYPELLCTRQKVAVAEHFGILPNIACAGRDFTYQFCYDVLNEVCELFPYAYIHIGGDEALKINWLTCPDCLAKMQTENLATPEALETYFLNKMASYLMAKGKKVICWNDGISSDKIDRNIIMHYWKDNAEFTKQAIKAIAKGQKAIVSPFANYYLDYNYGITPLKKTYDYEHCFLEDNVIGLEAPIWSEYINTVNKLERLAYPRLIAVAERAWTNKPDYDSFLTRLDFFNKKLDHLLIAYTPLGEVNPWFLKRLILKLKFYFYSIDKNIIKSFIKVWQYKKKKRLH
ncbi:MAG TPA: family 20 glycosylhydrolase, partial [Bacilli bacterium]|nr:family 20 glycosylhydrolase [Bacilli bacterium]